MKRRIAKWGWVGALLVITLIMGWAGCLPERPSWLPESRGRRVGNTARRIIDRAEQKLEARIKERAAVVAKNLDDQTALAHHLTADLRLSLRFKTPPNRESDTVQPIIPTSLARDVILRWEEDFPGGREAMLEHLASHPNGIWVPKGDDHLLEPHESTLREWLSNPNNQARPFTDFQEFAVKHAQDLLKPRD